MQNIFYLQKFFLHSRCNFSNSINTTSHSSKKRYLKGEVDEGTNNLSILAPAFTNFTDISFTKSMNDGSNLIENSLMYEREENWKSYPMHSHLLHTAITVLLSPFVVLVQ